MSANPHGNVFLALVRRFLGTVGADSVERKSNGYPFATGDSVQLVTDSVTCDSAVAAYNQAAGLTDSADAITAAYVIRLGATGYVVTNPARDAGEWSYWYWFDDHWVFKYRELG